VPDSKCGVVVQSQNFDTVSLDGGHQDVCTSEYPQSQSFGPEAYPFSLPGEIVKKNEMVRNTTDALNVFILF